VAELRVILQGSRRSANRIERSKWVTSRTQRVLAITGIVFVVLVAASILIVGNGPDGHASSAKVVAFYHAHKGAVVAASQLILLAVVVGLAFFWYFRDYLATTPVARRLATVGFAGAVVFAVGGGIASGAYFALADASGHVDPSTMQTLNLIQGDVSGGASEAGVALFLIASGVAILRSDGRLPTWVAWVGIVLGVASLVGILDIGLPAIGLWLLIVSITMLVRVHTPSTEIASNQPEPVRP
jgi:hypothetical protein